MTEDVTADITSDEKYKFFKLLFRITDEQSQRYTEFREYLNITPNLATAIISHILAILMTEIPESNDDTRKAAILKIMDEVFAVDVQSQAFKNKLMEMMENK